MSLRGSAHVRAEELELVTAGFRGCRGTRCRVSVERGAAVLVVASLVPSDPVLASTRVFREWERATSLGFLLLLLLLLLLFVVARRW